METYEILRDLAIILLSAKLCAMAARKLKFPQVAGQIVAGLIIGPCFLSLVQPSDFITKMAEIGVILVMFSAGLETDLKDLIKTGPKALAIACSGVFVPFALGALLYFAFYGFEGIGTTSFYAAMSIGAIMTATSVSITVAALQELGKLKGTVGTTILSSAIIDDVIGIIVLTVVIGFKNPDVKPSMVIIKTILFFIVAILGGMIAYKFFKWLDNSNPHTQRMFCPCLSGRKIFWHCRHYGSLCGGYCSLQLRRCGLYKQKNPYQYLHDFCPYIFCRHWIKNYFRQY